MGAAVKSIFLLFYISFYLMHIS